MKPNRKRARILVAEDDPTFGDDVAKVLRLDGHDVVRVMDGADALGRLASEGQSFDLLLCDLLLPRRSGFEVVREAKQLGLEVPILVMTGVYAQAREIAALRGLGVAGYVHKSVPLDHVLFRVNGILHPAQSDRRTPRVAVSVLVEYPAADGRRWATTYNLSEGGVYVRTPDPPPAGDVVDLVLALPTSREPVRVQAEVVHAATTEGVEGTGYPAGFGGRFLSPSPVAMSSIRRLVERVLADERTGNAIAGEGAAPATDLSPVLAQVCS
jgi:CheY-like chemotaxis protein